MNNSYQRKFSGDADGSITSYITVGDAEGVPKAWKSVACIDLVLYYNPEISDEDALNMLLEFVGDGEDGYNWDVIPETCEVDLS